MPRFINNRSGESVTCDMSLADMAARFAETADQENWLWFWIAKHCNRVGARNPEPAQPEIRNMLSFISDSFVMAVGRGLVNPMIRLGFRARDRRYKLYLSARGTVCLKGGNLVPGTRDPIGDEEYVGCFFDGRFLPNKERTPTPADQEFLDLLTNDPVNTMITMSKDMDRCCYCNQPLEDYRSKEAGYGETCASRWGLPWGKELENQEFPSFATLWSTALPEDKTDIRGICLAIRQEPTNSLHWNMLRDKLTDAGWPERMLPDMPARVGKMPRN